MPRTSNKRELILRFVTEFIREKGYSPSIREIGDAVGLRSTSSVHYQLTQLQKEGLLDADCAKNRTITLPSAADAPRRIPILGVVTAGRPILAVEHIEGYLPWDGSDDCFALRVRGDSMKNAGILPGDNVVVRPQSTADSGEIVVAMLGEEATVKRLWRKGSEILLMPENEAYDPIDGRNAVILGKVKAVVREY